MPPRAAGRAPLLRLQSPSRFGSVYGENVTGNAKDIFGSYMYAFWISGGLAVVGILLALTMMKEAPKRAR